MANEPQRIICLSGPPAIGKSTFARRVREQFNAAGLAAPPIVSPDDFVYDQGIYKWTPQRSQEAWRRAYRRLEQESLMKQDNRIILWDSTLTTPKTRIMLLKNFKSLTRAGASIELLVLPAPGLEELQRRNLERTPDRQVPSETILKMYREFIDPVNFPTKREGWAKIWTSPDDLLRDLEGTVLAPAQEVKKEQARKSSAKGISLSEKDFE